VDDFSCAGFGSLSFAQQLSSDGSDILIAFDNMGSEVVEEKITVGNDESPSETDKGKTTPQNQEAEASFGAYKVGSRLPPTSANRH
jgi:hypothetical protein